MVLEIQLWFVKYTLLAGIYKNNANNKTKTVYIRF